MKQRFYNWIYRILRKLGIRSTEHVNLNDLFEKVVEVSGGNHYALIQANIKIYGNVDKEIVKEFTAYDQRSEHFTSKDPYEAIDMLRRSLRNIEKSEQKIKSVEI